MGRHRRRKRAAVPVRTGLLGASAAMAMGAVAVASGLLPGGDTFTLGSGSQGKQVSSGDSALNTQGGSTAVPTSSPVSSPSRSATPTLTPSKAPAPKPAAPSPAPPKKTKAPEPTKPAPSPTPTRTRTAAPLPAKTSAEAAAQTVTSREAAAEAAVLDLVNQERARAGCSPLRASSDLTSLARAFSQDMAARDFFSHTDPDGDGPWDRAAQAGVEGLGGENIARGQADAAAVMDAWMNSEGHRANILNCDFTTLGVGVHFGDGGPWWTQNFGF
ncbi:CAP domain-containing protein [Streptomyces coeruleoprunus]|uniref:CAP domain-containing protein n=1 Tax=Streptomyces coeruleoprunus TaxID=285563 RepID=A0ABV9XEN0_9ACTN